MPNKLRSTSGRVSFFAFLDMITTVTGVLLLITLVQTLYLNDSPATPAAPAREAVREQVEQARAQLEANQAQLRQRLLQAVALTNRVFVVPEADRSGKEPILIVLSATNGLCMRLGKTNAVEFLRLPDGADFEHMMDHWDPHKERLVFYVRPSGVAHFRDCKERAANRSFTIGYDAALEDLQYFLATP